MVKAVEEKEISVRHELDRMLEKVPAPRVDSSNRCRRMKTCERGCKGGGDWQERKSKKQPGKGPKGPLEGRNHQMERWRFQEKRKEEKWKKKKKKVSTEKGNVGRSAKNSSSVCL